MQAIQIYSEDQIHFEQQLLRKSSINGCDQALDDKVDRLKSLVDDLVAAVELPRTNLVKIFYQVKVYLLTYMAYTIIHLEKQYWSFSKAVISSQDPDILSK
jgi:sugar phosphate permease